MSWAKMACRSLTSCRGQQQETAVIIIVIMHSSLILSSPLSTHFHQVFFFFNYYSISSRGNSDADFWHLLMSVARSAGPLRSDRLNRLKGMRHDMHTVQHEAPLRMICNPCRRNCISRTEIYPLLCFYLRLPADDVQLCKYILTPPHRTEFRTLERFGLGSVTWPLDWNCVSLFFCKWINIIFWANAV